jgi:hypothetical protein
MYRRACRRKRHRDPGVRYAADATFLVFGD